MRSSSAQRDLLRLAQNQRERLAFVDFKVFFSGELRRADLESRFGIAPAAATRDLSCYRGLAPDNLVYDPSAKTYTLGDRFSPVFPIAVDRALAWLRQGYGDGLTLSIGRPVPADGADLLVPPPIELLGTVARAIHRGDALKVCYQSLSSGLSEREIVPLALVDNGLRWHVRAFDRKNSRFGDFVINRISGTETDAEPVVDLEKLPADEQWNREIELQLVPHPGVAHPKAIEADYGIADGVLRVKARAAVVGYALVRWGVDCTPKHTLDYRRHHLWLRNAGVLAGVESAVMAPGYSLREGSDAFP